MAGSDTPMKKMANNQKTPTRLHTWGQKFRIVWPKKFIHRDRQPSCYDSMFFPKIAPRELAKTERSINL